MTGIHDTSAMLDTRNDLQLSYQAAWFAARLDHGRAMLRR
jgi:hypothetical protein